VKSVISFCNKANGRNPCVWCSEDDTITTSTTYEGTSMLMEHLLSSRLSHENGVPDLLSRRDLLSRHDGPHPSAGHSSLEPQYLSFTITVPPYQYRVLIRQLVAID
jgi:hypothetical protein